MSVDVRLARRSMLLHGLGLVLRRPGALLWTYTANLGVALLFSLRLHGQLGSLLNHSMAAQRMNAGFDLGVVGAVFARLGNHVPSSGAAAYAGLPVYFLIYFLLVPGALFCYRAGASGRSAFLLSAGLCFFWRFVRITLLTGLVSALVLGPLFALYGVWTTHVDEQVVGGAQLWHRVPVLIVIVLVASVLRLYFDLVEVYTVQLDEQVKANGRPDRRVRRVLLPALRTLWRNLPRALGSFVLLALIGVAAVLLTGRVALHMLAQPRVWPAFLLIQAGLFVNLMARFWQRGGETILAADYPLGASLLVGERVRDGAARPSCFAYAGPTLVEPASPSVWRNEVIDVQPGPEPAAPSPSDPDGRVYRVPPPPEASVV